MGKPPVNIDPAIQVSALRQFPEHKITSTEKLAAVWSGYGEIIRCKLTGPRNKSLVVKHIKAPKNQDHPRGWNTDISHTRKMRSFEVEANWYRAWASNCHALCRIPEPYSIDASDGEFLFLLEDMDAAGFPMAIAKPDLQQLRLCLRWLANFHATFMGSCVDEPKFPLWEVGSYWHLATRQDELLAITDGEICAAAPVIDAELNTCQFKTIIHGDAKIANFCFAKNMANVAALDFQYVGAGCGMKDVMLLFSSSMDAESCYKFGPTLVNYYFQKLQLAMLSQQPHMDFSALEQEWRKCYPLAWADYLRFLKGWCPDHARINTYSEFMTKQALNFLDEKQK